MRIVIVDDSMLIQLQLRRFFEDEMGYTIVGVGGDGESAIQLYKGHKPDLIMLDLVMPKKSGYDALVEIIKYDSNATAIMCTATRNTKMLNLALSLGARSYIKKPLEFHCHNYVTEFKADIREALES